MEKNVKYLLKDLAKFVHGRENLNAILGAQRSNSERQGIGKKPSLKHVMHKPRTVKHKYASHLSNV